MGTRRGMPSFVSAIIVPPKSAKWTASRSLIHRSRGSSGSTSKFGGGSGAPLDSGLRTFSAIVPSLSIVTSDALIRCSSRASNGTCRAWNSCGHARPPFSTTKARISGSVREYQDVGWGTETRNERHRDVRELSRATSVRQPPGVEAARGRQCNSVRFRPTTSYSTVIRQPSASTSQILDLIGAP